jgi:hypothetical protein
MLREGGALHAQCLYCTKGAFMTITPQTGVATQVTLTVGTTTLDFTETVQTNPLHDTVVWTGGNGTDFAHPITLVGIAAALMVGILDSHGTLVPSGPSVPPPVSGGN